MKVNESDMEVNEPVLDYNLLDLNGSYTYVDYMRWMFKERVELIKGKIVKMSPAPSNIHQELSLNLSVLSYNIFHKKSCKVYAAPFDVRLPIPSTKKDTTVVQPDITVVCDANKLKDHGCNGTPDLVVEILSSSNTGHDLRVKFNLYQESGVKEYWIVDPSNKSVLLYFLKDNKYIGLHPFTEDDTIESATFPELIIAVEEIFSGVK